MRSIGFLLALIVWLVAGYEMLALTTSLPTISRILQGWRDSGFGTVVTIIALAIGASLVWFAQWIWYHLRYEKRSNN